MYWVIDRSFVEFDEFDGYEKTTENFKSLCTFNISSDPKGSCYNGVLFGLLFNIFKNSMINK